MYMLFLDESGSLAKPENAAGRYLVIGGVIIPEGAWQGVRSDLDRIRKKYNVTGEIKWKFFGRGNTNRDNSLSHLENEQKDEFRKEVYSIITSRKAVKLVCCVTCQEAAYSLPNINSQGDLYHLTYKGVTERFQYFLQDSTRITGQTQYGIVISDHRMNADDKKLRKRHHDLMDGGNKYSSNYANIIETIMFSPSHVSPGLQLADMVAGAVHRAYEHAQPEFATLVRPAFRTSPSGEISGYGIVKMPRHGFIEPRIEKRGAAG